jgi:hypothetical protein
MNTTTGHIAKRVRASPMTLWACLLNSKHPGIGRVQSLQNVWSRMAIGDLSQLPLTEESESKPLTMFVDDCCAALLCLQRTADDEDEGKFKVRKTKIGIGKWMLKRGCPGVVDFSEQKDRLDPLPEMRRRANGHQNYLTRPLLSIFCWQPRRLTTVCPYTPRNCNGDENECYSTTKNALPSGAKSKWAMAAWPWVSPCASFPRPRRRAATSSSSRRTKGRDSGSSNRREGGSDDDDASRRTRGSSVAANGSRSQRWSSNGTWRAQKVSL